MLEVQAPPLRPVVGGLLAHVQPIDLPRNPAEGVMHKGLVTGRTTYIPGTDPMNPPGEGEPVPEKEFGDLIDVTAQSFTIYRGVEVALFRQAEAEGRLDEAFAADETFAVENGFMATVLPNATDVTPDFGAGVEGFAKPIEAIAFAEQWAAENIPGRPVFHVNRAGAALLDVEDEDGRLYTKQGTPVVNGGGYPAFMAHAVARVFTIVITGEPALWRGPTIKAQVPQYRENLSLALIERQYATTYGGGAAYVTVAAPSAGG